MDIYSILISLGIPYTKYEHAPFFTCEDADEFYKNMPGGHSKNLFLKAKKSEKYYLFILESHKRADLKVLAYFLGESGLSFASANDLMHYLKVIPGLVSPFALIHDEAKAVQVILDKDLLRHDTLYYHPNINTSTLGIKREDFERFLRAMDCKLHFT